MNHFARRIRTSVQRELDAAREADSQGLAQIAFVHLERAHVLGQASTVEHVRVHLRMFVWAARHRKTGEALGQLWRIAAAALMTGIGWLPEGNTGDGITLAELVANQEVQSVARHQRRGGVGRDSSAVNFR